MLSIYVHIPFCLKKCDYCDFFSIPCERASVPEREYLAALLEQLDMEIASNGLTGEALSTVYFGGGTPSLMSPSFFEGTLARLRDRFHPVSDIEVSCEVNPATVDRSWFVGARESGITRASIGVQSFHGDLLKALGRVHSADDAMRAIAEAQDAGFDSVSMDLMYGIPGETISQLEDDLRTAMTFQPSHVSAYQLTLEEGTPLAMRLDEEGLLCDVEALKQMRIVARMLSRGGWSRYEISNFSKSGFACRHNLNYWRYGEFLGLGAGAASFLHIGNRDAGNTPSRESRVTSHGFARRWTQVRDVKAYLAGTGELAEDEAMDRRTSMAEFCFMGLRTTEGIALERFRSLFGEEFEACLGRASEELIAEGLLERSDGNLSLTPSGVELSNQAFERFLP